MKTLRIFASALAVLALAAGCSKVAEIGDETPFGKGGTVITAGLNDTKTALQPDGKKVYWEAGDAIAVNGIKSEPLKIEAPAAKADFEFSETLAEAKKAVYPASVWQAEGSILLPSGQGAGTDVSFGQNALPMVAYAESGNSLKFKHIAAVIKVGLTAGSTSAPIEYDEFSGNNGEQVSGEFSVDYSSGAITSLPSYSDSDKAVRVSVGKTLGAGQTAVFIAVPPANYSKGFTVKVVDASGASMIKHAAAITLKAGTVYPTPVTEFEDDGTIKAFAKEYVKILDEWEKNVGTIKRTSNWALAQDGDTDVVENAHYVPSDFTVTVGDKTYTTGDMLETALRSYLLFRGWDGNATNVAGWGAFASTTPVSMDAPVPQTHGYKFGSPLIESSNGGYLYKTIGGLQYYGQVDPVILDNWAQRSVNWAMTHDKVITNLCGYPRDPITNYGGCFSSGRALLTYAFFFKYMLDNNLDKADALGADVVIRSELFGLETQNRPDIKLTTTELSFGCDAQTQAASFDAYTDWTATASDGWITVSPSSGSAGKITVDVSVAANTGAAREGKVTISGGNVTEGLEIKVSQAEYTAPAPATIKDFAQEYVKILEIWDNTTGTIDLLKGEDYTGGSFNVEDAHYIPSTTTITVGGKTYNTADMFETAIRSYLLVRGYNGLDRTSVGAGSIAALADGAKSMSETIVPETHGYMWGASPYNETSGNGGYFRTTSGTSHVASIDVLDNWAMRALNFQSGKTISNMCTYPRSPITSYTGSFSSMRALITYAFFFEYMLDNNLEKADGLAGTQSIRSELLGVE